MKHLCAIFCLFLAVAAGLPAQTNGSFIGPGIEASGNGRESAAMTASLILGVDINEIFAAGVKVAFSHDFNTVSALEPQAFFRWYFLESRWRGPFVELQAGGTVFLEHGKGFPAFQGGISAGWRFDLGEFFYVEPSARGGYPYIYGAGVSFGVRLGGSAGVRAAKPKPERPAFEEPGPFEDGSSEDDI